MNEQPSKEAMIKKIYEVIADKTLSFGCKIEYPIWNICIVEWRDERRIKVESESIVNRTLSTSILPKDQRNSSVLDKYKIIWHPVMIWDVLDWISRFGEWSFTVWWNGIIDFWQWQWKFDFRKPIDDQSDDCITFIYNLIHND